MSATDVHRRGGPHTLDARLLPYGRTLACAAETPLLVMLDVTESCGETAESVLAALPRFCRNLEKLGLLRGAALSVAAVGDHIHDRAPFQLTDFVGGRELQDWLDLIWLERGGGPGSEESYGYLAWYYAARAVYSTAQRGWCFIIADEAPYPRLCARAFEQHFGCAGARDMAAADAFDMLRTRYDVVCLHPAYRNGSRPLEDRKIFERWRELLGDRARRCGAPDHIIAEMVSFISARGG